MMRGWAKAVGKTFPAPRPVGDYDAAQKIAGGSLPASNRSPCRGKSPGLRGFISQVRDHAPLGRFAVIAFLTRGELCRHFSVACPRDGQFPGSADPGNWLGNWYRCGCLPPKATPSRTRRSGAALSGLKGYFYTCYRNRPWAGWFPAGNPARGVSRYSRFSIILFHSLGLPSFRALQ